jgi:hypothetical protein
MSGPLTTLRRSLPCRTKNIVMEVLKRVHEEWIMFICHIRCCPTPGALWLRIVWFLLAPLCRRPLHTGSTCRVFASPADRRKSLSLFSAAHPAYAAYLLSESFLGHGGFSRLLPTCIVADCSASGSLRSPGVWSFPTIHILQVSSPRTHAASSPV